jgi:hypothetical protein
MKTRFHDTHYPAGPLNLRYAASEALVRLAVSKHEKRYEGSVCITTLTPTWLGRCLPRRAADWFVERAMTLSALRFYGVHLTDEAHHQHLLKMHALEVQGRIEAGIKELETWANEGKR